MRTCVNSYRKAVTCGFSVYSNGKYHEKELGHDKRRYVGTALDPAPLVNISAAHQRAARRRSGTRRLPGDIGSAAPLPNCVKHGCLGMGCSERATRLMSCLSRRRRLRASPPGALLLQSRRPGEAAGPGSRSGETLRRTRPPHCYARRPPWPL